MRSPPSPGHGYVLVDCSGESDPMISPTESSRVACMPEHGPPPPDRRVGCTGPGRAGGVRVGACGRIGDWKTSLRAKQPRRGGSQLWCSADARAESRGLSKPRCKRCLPGSPRSGEDELRGSCVFKVLPGRCNHCQSSRRVPKRPVRNVGPKAVWARAVCGRQAGLIRVEQAWAVPELVK